MTSLIEIVAYRPEWRGDFARLNREWLEQLFRVEAIDEALLADPEGRVLDRGGAIFFACAGQAIVGTVALLAEAPGVYEIGKMAVMPQWQGRGVGRRLLGAALHAYDACGGTLLFLESHSSLKPALALYESMGFVRQPECKPDSHYGRSDVYMIYTKPT